MVFFTVVLFILIFLPVESISQNSNQQAIEWRIKGTLAALDDSIPEIRKRALKKLSEFECLDRIKDYQIQHIIELLEDSDSKTRSIAVKALKYNKDGLTKTHISQIVKLIRHNNSAIQMSGVYALKDIGKLTKHHICQIAEMLKNPDSKVRCTALLVLGNLGKYAKNHVPRIAALLQDPDSTIRYAAIIALGNMGELAKDHIPQIAAMSEENDSNIRRAVVEVLGNMGRLAKDHAPKIACLLEDDDVNVRSATVKAMGKFGNESKNYIPMIIELLKDDYGTVRQSAVESLCSLNRFMKEYIPIIAERLRDSNENVRSSAVKVIGEMEGLGKEYIPEIISLLEDKSSSVRYSAIDSLKNLNRFIGIYLPQIVSLLNDERPYVRIAALLVLDNCNRLKDSHAKKIIYLLKDSNPNVRDVTVEVLRKKPALLNNNNIGMIEEFFLSDDPDIRINAMRVMGTILSQKEKERIVKRIAIFLEDSNPKLCRTAIRILGNSTKNYLPNIFELLETAGPEVRLAAIEALANLKELGKEHIAHIATLLKNSNPDIRYAAVEILGGLNGLSKEYIPYIIKLLRDDNLNVRSSAVIALEKVTQLDIQYIPFIIDPIYDETSRCSELRFLAHLTGAGKKNVEILLSYVGKPGSYPEKLNHTQAIKILRVFDNIWKYSSKCRGFQSDLEKQIADIISRKNVKWKKDDLELLQNHFKNLESIKSTRSESVKKVITSIKTDKGIYSVAKVLLIHFLFWTVFIVAYPRSLQVQAIFFWNPYIRRIVGLGYVNFALTWIPFLRRKLFQPFQKLLVADALLDYFDEDSYFEGSVVQQKYSNDLLLLKDAITELKGHIILEGESGLGKSMFVKYLLRNSDRVSVYLPAEKCSKGIMEAIKAKLPDLVKDTNYLKKLIYAGAIDICIDGLNEVNAEVRANVIKFVEHYPHGNIIIVTQPIEWKSPSTAKTYIIQPLRHDQIKKFLTGRLKQIVPNGINISDSDYEHKCNTYLDKALNNNQHEELLESAQRILSNPMDLTIVAQLLSLGKQPELFDLQKQQYIIMAEDYCRIHAGKTFPIDEFSERIYQMCIDNDINLPKNYYPDEIRCMQHKNFKMTIIYQSINKDGSSTKEWRFRHEKIKEYFILHTFLNNKKRQYKHLNDPRFRGVYFMLATRLPEDDAKKLIDLLFIKASQTKNHGIADRFIQLFFSRPDIKKEKEIIELMNKSDDE